MSIRRGSVAVFLLFASVTVRGQSASSAAPTYESIVSLIETANGYVRLVADALVWKSPSTDQCSERRSRIEGIAKGRLLGPPPGELSQKALQAMYARAEDNTMSTLAMFSREVYEVVRLGCLVVPKRPALPR